MHTLIKQSGFALIMAGLCFAIPNAIILPYVDFNAPFGELLTSTTFFYRMLFAALTVAFLLFGTVGLLLYHHQVNRARLFRQVAFIMAFFGSAFMLANEWHQLFVLPDVASISLDTANAVGSSDEMGRYGIGAMIALTLFSFGWILFNISFLISRKLKRLGPILVLIGFLIIPLISGLVSPILGSILGSVCMGIGFCLIGMELIKSN